MIHKDSDFSNDSHSLVNKPFLSLKEAARFLSISTSLMYKLSANGTIPKYKPAGIVYFKPNELIAWVEQARIESSSDIALEVDDLLSSISKGNGTVKNIKKFNG